MITIFNSNMPKMGRKKKIFCYYVKHFKFHFNIIFFSVHILFKFQYFAIS